MPSATYESSIDLGLGSTPRIDESFNPELYQELLDLHSALEKIADLTPGTGATAPPVTYNFATVAIMVAATNLSVGDFCTVDAYTGANNSGVLFFEVVAAATGTDDGGRFIDLNTHQARANFSIGFYTVEQWGADGDGATAAQDVPIQAAIDYVESVGGGLLRALGASYLIDNTIVINDHYVEFLGQGLGIGPHNVGSLEFVTMLLWNGAVNGTIMQVTAVSGGANQNLRGCGVRSIFFDGNFAGDTADIGLEILSHSYGVFDNLFFTDFLDVGLHTDVVATLGEATDTGQNHFRNISCRFFNTTGTFMKLDGDASGNTSYNLFENIVGQIDDGDGLDFINADNNTFITTRISRAGGGTGNGIIFRAGPTVTQTGRYNNFIHWFAQDNIAEGTDVDTFPSHDNNMLLADIGNAAQAPVLGTGATVWESTMQGVQLDSRLVSVGIGDSHANAITAQGLITSESALIYNTSSNHIRLANGTETWGVNIDAAQGDFRLVRVAGTGNIQVPAGITVDGRDISVDGTKLDTVETNAKDDQSAAEVSFSATGTISSTDVQAAIAELDTEKLALAGGTMTGTLIGSNSSDQYRVKAGTDEWGINISSSNLRVNRIGGAGKISLQQVVDTTESYQVDGTQVVKNRSTGWTSPTGTQTRTGFATATVTTEVLAQHVHALIDDLIVHGMIGT